jgi:preflagellin peptidase FlaK
MLGINIEPDIIRIVIALGMLIIASVLDMRKREINDLLWIGFGAVAFVMFIISGDLWGTAKMIGLSMIIAPIVLVIWRLGIFGGADALCLIVLAGLAPMASIYGTGLTPITPLTNAAVISVIPIFANLVRNLFAISRKQNIFEGLDETRLNKIIAIFVGYRAKNPKFSFSIEHSEGNHKRLDFGFQHAENAQFCSTSETWVTPGIPYIIFITAGFIVQIIYGDIIVNLIKIIW